MQKKTKVIITTMTTLAATSLGTGMANADTTQNTSAHTETTSTVSNKVTENEVKQAKQNVATARSEVTAAQANVSSAQKQENTDKQKVKDAPTKIPEIQSSIKNQESTINKNQETIDHDKQDINSQQSKVNADKQNVSSIQSKVIADKQNVSSAQSSVDRDQQRINDIHNAQSIASSMKNKVASDKQNVADEQSTQDNAQKAVDQAKSNQAIANAKVSSAQSSLANAQNKENQDQNKLNDTQKKLDTVNDQINSINSITLPNGYNNKSIYDENVNTQLFNEGMNNPANSYHPSNADNYQVNPTNLTASQQRELNIWTASIINPIRKQLGNLPMHVNQSAIDFANAVSANYDADKWSLWNGHDVPAIEKAAAQFGLDSKDGNLYECAASGMPTNECTMNDLKSAVYDGLKRLLFTDTAHAQSIIGQNFGNNQAPSYFGLSIDKEGNLHFEQIHTTTPLSAFNSDVQDPSKFNVNNNYAVPTNDISTLKLQQSSLQSQVNSEKNTVKDDKQAVSNAQNALNSAKNAQTQANTDLANKQTALTNANNALQQAQIQLSKDEATLDQAQKDIANAPAELKAANTQLAKDNQVLSNAKSALSDVQNKLADAENVQTQDETKLNDLNAQLKRDKQQLANNQAILVQLQKQLIDYQNAPTELKDDETKLASSLTRLKDVKKIETQAEIELAKLQNIYDAEQKKILNDQQTVKHDQQVLNELIKSGASQNDISKMENILNQAKEQLIRDEKSLNHVVSTAEINSTYVLSSHAKRTNVEAKNETSDKSNTKQRKMPKTGEKSSISSIIGSSLLAILSFFGLELRKKNK